MAITFLHTRLVDRGAVLAADYLRVADGVITAIGGPDIAHPGDELVTGGTLLPGLIDAHVHLIPGATRLAARYGVTTLIDQFSQPDLIAAERAAGADFRTSSIGATAPGGHPTLAFEPFPYVEDPKQFVADRIAEGADHLKLIYDDGSGIAMDIPSLDEPTIRALVEAAHANGLKVVAHVSAAASANTLALHQAGVQVLAGTDAPNPGLVFGASLHCELQHLARGAYSG